MRPLGRRLATLAVLSASLVFANYTDPNVLDACPGYKTTNVHTSGSTLTADLVLAGEACNVYGSDIEQLKLEVTYETNTRIHVKITDPSSDRYEVPESVVPRPDADPSVSSSTAEIRFNYTASPFAFSIYRAATHEVLFSTASHPIIFEPQYLRVKTNLPDNANIYGLGEHTDSFRLPTFNTTRTFWSRDAYGVPTGSNLYGNHPIYFEHRTTGTHGVFLLNSNGMDVKINDTAGTSLEYNVIGGVLDFYFLAGSTTDPVEAARQYAEIVGAPAEVPYWSFGLHQCRFGYQNYLDVANVIANYSKADIPLETMWTDIDYMYKRRIFTVDPDYFPLARMREIVDYLHSNDQHYVLMTDPAIAYLPGGGYGPFDRGTQADIWLMAANDSSPFLGAVWPGVTVFPDWFSNKTQDYWTNEFQLFYDPQSGLDIDGAWIDMNEPSSFCNYPCTDPFEQAQEQDLPPARTSSPPDPNAPMPWGSQKRKRVDHSGDDLQNPLYAIQNDAGSGALSDRTAYVDAKHANGLVEYDTHNLYGTMMSTATHNAMLARRPGLRTLVITRSTFAGAGAHVGKWLGDNFSDWDHYRNSIAGILGMASIFHVPMVGADICGYAENTTETLCARWAMLGAFYPFMRNHNADTSISQEFYLWPTVAQAARNVLDIRYRLMDYIYTAFHQAHEDGTPVLNPLWYKYPEDPATFPIDLQFFFGDSILVSPVTEENSTSVTAYFPKDTFYDFLTLAPFEGTGANMTLSGINFTSIPVHIKGGAVLPLREKGTMTTTQLRETDFELVVAPDASGEASGSLYADDGVSITPATSTSVSFSYQNGTLAVAGEFGYSMGVNVSRVRFLGVVSAPTTVKANGQTVQSGAISYDKDSQVLDVTLDTPFNEGFTVQHS
ncbi:glycoside hydrolase family 31 protein [Phanerochaete carnosa HHB-10118-sp]|uniref:beta-glucosidase n=1 Tax=Phanerochaete carnosa (strain HHB-10118-sp) TaxID=650164 RepID=K5WAS6_PHACS|nr:glycoside hydrolase family 31 protein [Phanerochaete carnosa HHB-10118-sp]EKM56094.1 glycoside hydrolase family 31 protein [Phanerochaete carnosa HHB-10118-sp]